MRASLTKSSPVGMGFEKHRVDERHACLQLAREGFPHINRPLHAQSAPPTHRRWPGQPCQGSLIACCIQNKIDLMVLPAHSSHITQPLDVGIFAPLKAAMAWQADRWTSLHPGRVAKADWCSNMVQARLKAMTEANIRAGWRSTGLYPFQPSRVIPDVPVPLLHLAKVPGSARPLWLQSHAKTTSS